MGKTAAPMHIPAYRQQQRVNDDLAGLHGGEYFQEQSTGWRFMLAMGIGCLFAAAAGFVWWLSP